MFYHLIWMIHSFYIVLGNKFPDMDVFFHRGKMLAYYLSVIEIIPVNF